MLAQPDLSVLISHLQYQFAALVETELTIQKEQVSILFCQFSFGLISEWQQALLRALVQPLLTRIETPSVLDAEREPKFVMNTIALALIHEALIVQVGGRTLHVIPQADFEQVGVPCIRHSNG